MKLDEERTMQLIAPRQEQAWARTYIQRAERAEGRLQEPGRAAIRRAKTSGRYDSMAEVDDLIEPEALKAAADARARYCDGLPKPSEIPPKKSGSPPSWSTASVEKRCPTTDMTNDSCPMPHQTAVSEGFSATVDLAMVPLLTPTWFQMSNGVPTTVAPSHVNTELPSTVIVKAVVVEMVPAPM